MVGRGDYKVQCVTTFVGRFTYVLLQAMVVKDVIQLHSTGVWWHDKVNVNNMTRFGGVMSKDNNEPLLIPLQNSKLFWQST